MVRIGVIGIGWMGAQHAKLIKNTVKGCTLAAISSLEYKTPEEFQGVPRFSDSRDLIRSGLVDAVVIATPHYMHTTVGIDALQHGLHVLVEKPMSVHKADCERMIAAHANKKLVFAAMFQMRLDPHYVRIKRLIDRGELGEIQRTSWIMTEWFRTDYYYASGDWRATWEGEGGGVLLNQCPHNLDLFQWLCGMPSRVRAFCGLGKHHKIEVEDEVTAYLEYPNGATGVFVTSTGEYPGTNRLEIAADMGKVVCEGGKIAFTRNEVTMRESLRTLQESFATPDVWNVEIPATGGGPQHAGIIQNFVDAIRDGAPLIAPAAEGLRSVELANAMLMSSLTDKSVELPIDGAAFEAMLKELIADSKARKEKSK